MPANFGRLPLQTAHLNKQTKQNKRKKKTMAKQTTQARQTWKQAYQAQRKAIARDCKAYLRGLRPAIELAQANIAKLAQQVRADAAPALQAIRERDAFINSGKSLFAWAASKESGAVPAFKKLIAPPLPYVGKLPPNK